MKNNILKIVVTIFVFGSMQTINAQFGNNQNGRMNGMNQMGSMSQRSEPVPEKAPTSEEIVSKHMKEMKPALGLDELQTVAVSQALVESLNAQGRLSKLNLPQEDLMKEYKLLTEGTDKKILSYLNKEQIEKYQLFKEEMFKPKKSKSKKKEKAAEIKAE